ncbi:MAG: FHA domain-containing serine/threonine-protein kinase [Acidobacteriota bacterium]
MTWKYAGRKRDDHNSMQVNLRVLAGPYKGRVFPFDQHDTFLIGRTNDAHLCLPDDRFFSRHHCLLEIAPPRCFLRDLGSTNGTFVNGQRVSRTFLHHGDQIQGGESILQVEVSASEYGQGERDAAGGQPVVVSVDCLNCGRREQAQAATADEHLTFLCEDCRQELRNEPQPVPGYDMVRVIGRGGMGCVTLALHQQTGRAVAIKMLLPECAVSDKAMRRFMREIDVAAALKHPNIVEFLDRGTNNGVVYLVTEFVDGPDAARLADEQGGKLPYPQAIAIISQVLGALSYAHGQGFIHRDIKDQNILISGVQDNIVAKLTDFGLAKSFAKSGMSGVTMAGEAAGTISYMSPEQLRNFRDVRPQSDIYSVGMTAYSLLTGELALDLAGKSSIAETVKAIFEQPPTPLGERAPRLPTAVCEIVDRALLKDPAQRWQSAGAMRTALLHAA